MAGQLKGQETGEAAGRGTAEVEGAVVRNEERVDIHFTDNLN